MVLSVPIYLVTVFAAFLYAVIKNFVPDLPLTEDQVVWFVLAILAALNIDVVQALRSARVAGIR
jgi:hypothetical protein